MAERAVKGAGVRLAENPAEDGQVVAEGLTRGGGRHHHGVLPGGHAVEDIGLMAVETLNAPHTQRVA